MSCTKRILLILAVCLAIDVFATPSVFAQRNEDTFLYLVRKASELFTARKYAEAVPLALGALAIREEELGPNDPGVAGLVSMVGLLYESQDRRADAERLFKRALAIHENAPVPDRFEVETSLNNLARVYRSQGRDTDADALYRRVLPMKKKVLGSADGDIR